MTVFPKHILMSVYPLYQIFCCAEMTPKPFRKEPSIAGKTGMAAKLFRRPTEKSPCIPFSLNDVADIYFLPHFLSP